MFLLFNPTKLKLVLIWAWWTGMSGVAGMLHDLWYSSIICIDANQSELTNKLKAKGLEVIIGHGKYKIQPNDVVIYSEATANSVEVLEAKEKKIKEEEVFVTKTTQVVDRIEHEIKDLEGEIEWKG